MRPLPRRVTIVALVAVLSVPALFHLYRRYYGPGEVITPAVAPAAAPAAQVDATYGAFLAWFQAVSLPLRLTGRITRVTGS